MVVIREMGQGIRLVRIAVQFLQPPHNDSGVGSDVIYIHMFGKPVIVLNSMQAANDLFEKRSSIYSDR